MTPAEEKKAVGEIYLSFDLLLEHLTAIRREVRLIARDTAPHNSVIESRFEFISSKFDLVDLQSKTHITQIARLAKAMGFVGNEE